MRVEVNEQQIDLPKFASVNGALQSGYYSIQENDQIEILSYYTVRQIAEFMDVIINQEMNIYVNNKLADMDTKVYENFSVIWTMEELHLSDYDAMPDSYADLPEDDMPPEKKEPEAAADVDGAAGDAVSQGSAGESGNVGVNGNANAAGNTGTGPVANGGAGNAGANGAVNTGTGASAAANSGAGNAGTNGTGNTGTGESGAATQPDLTIPVTVSVNGQPVQLTGKKEYVFVDVFEKIDFDLSRPKGSGIVTRLNGREAQYMESIHSGDTIEIYWKN
jgi:hypothetical protein